jgi:hypothetical protein
MEFLVPTAVLYLIAKWETKRAMLETTQDYTSVVYSNIIMHFNFARCAQLVCGKKKVETTTGLAATTKIAMVCQGGASTAEQMGQFVNLLPELESSHSMQNM